MVEVCVDGGSQLCLIALVIELEQLSLVIALAAPRSICVVALCALSIHHLDLVFEQPHGLDLVLELKPLALLVQLLRLCQIREENVNDVGVVVEFQHSAIELAFLPC